MKSVIKVANDLDVAIALGLKELEEVEKNVEVHILEHGKRMFFGLFNSPYKVEIRLKEEKCCFNKNNMDGSLRSGCCYKTKYNVERRNMEPVLNKVPEEVIELKSAYCLEFLRNVINILDPRYKNIRTHYNENTECIEVYINDDFESGIFSYHGSFLDNLQHLIGVVVNQDRFYVKVSLHSKGQKRKLEKKFKTLAAKSVEYVLKTGRDRLIYCETPYERLLVHQVVEKTEGVSSLSVGKGTDKKVLIKRTPTLVLDKNPCVEKERCENKEQAECTQDVPLKNNVKEAVATFSNYHL